MRRGPDAVGGAVIALAGGVILAGGLATPDPGFGVVGPQVMPTILGALIIVVGAWIAITNPSALATEAEPVDARPLALGAALLAAYLLVFVPLGFVLSSAAFLIAQARILGSRALLRDSLAAAGFALALYLLFTRLLTVDLPPGILPL
jgi:putative tricarboxylic transport membrane protein